MGCPCLRRSGNNGSKESSPEEQHLQQTKEDEIEPTPAEPETHPAETHPAETPPAETPPTETSPGPETALVETTPAETHPAPETPAQRTSNSLASGEKNQKEKGDVKDMKLADLKLATKEIFATKIICAAPGIHGLDALVYELIEEDPEFYLEQLKPSLAGQAFLEKLSSLCPNETVEDFSKRCKALERKDMVNYLDKLPSGALLVSLDLVSKANIANHLKPSKTPGVKHWQHFCEEYAFGHIVIGNISNQIEACKEDPNTSFILLIDLLKESDLGTTVGDLIKACENIKRFDMVELLNNKSFYT